MLTADADTDETLQDVPGDDTPGNAVGDGDGDGAGNDEAAPAEGAADEATPDEVVVVIGDDAPQADEEEARAPSWLRELRKSNREKDRRIRELESKLNAPAAAPAAVVVGERPKLADYNFDEDEHSKAVDAWHERKSAADAQAATARKAEETAKANWASTLKSYERAASELKVSDYTDAEASAKDVLSVTQQGLILTGADNPAALVYVLGKNLKKAQELAAIADPVKFAFAVAKLETQLKILPRRTAPLPESTVRGSAPGAGATNARLQNLLENARKTGDYNPYYAAKRKAEAK